MEPIKCAACDKPTERPRHFRQKEYCSKACIDKVIEARNKNVKELADKKTAEASPE